MTECPEPAKAFDHANTGVACYKHDTFQQSSFSNWSYIFKNYSLVYLHIKNITNETSAKVMVKVRIIVTKKKHWFLVLLPAIISSVPPVFSSSSVKRWQIIWWYIFLRLLRISMTKCFWLHEMMQNTLCLPTDFISCDISWKGKKITLWTQLEFGNIKKLYIF